MFSELGLFILLSLYLWKKAKDYQDQDLWNLKTAPTVSQGSVEYNGAGLHISQAIYFTYWFYFSIDCYNFETGRLFPISVCLFV